MTEQPTERPTDYATLPDPIRELLEADAFGTSDTDDTDDTDDC